MKDYYIQYQIKTKRKTSTNIELMHCLVYANNSIDAIIVLNRIEKEYENEYDLQQIIKVIPKPDTLDGFCTSADNHYRFMEPEEIECGCNLSDRIRYIEEDEIIMHNIDLV